MRRARRHILFEGNRGANLDNDDTHGNANYHTYFRNWGTGYRYGSFVDQAATVHHDRRCDQHARRERSAASGWGDGL